MRRVPGQLVGLLAAAVLVALAGCTTTTTTTSDGNVVPTPAANAADPERRAQARLELAGLYFARGQNQIALDEIRQALLARPDMPEAIGLRALVMAAMGDGVGAEASFQRAMQLSPGDAGLIHNHGWFLCNERRWADAEAAFDRAIAVPRYDGVARSWMAKGACQARAGRWAEAERSLSRSYELDPTSPVTAFNLAEVLLRRGELQRARFYVGRINAVPEQVNAQSLWLAARIERRIGDTTALQDYGRKLRERFPQAPETLRFERGRFED
jgi:type IV pilus assembly protein PilF